MQQAELSLILTPGSSLLSPIFNPEVKLEAICSSEPHNLKTDDYSSFRIDFFGERSNDEGRWDRLYTSNMVCIVLQACYAADTACSSSGNLSKQAYGTICHGNCDSAIVNGSQLSLHSYILISVQFLELDMLNPQECLTGMVSRIVRNKVFLEFLLAKYFIPCHLRYVHGC
jgi:hypothetical protein